MSVCLVAQSCLTLCDPTDHSPPGSSVHEIFQARILEWVAISISRGSSWPRDWTWVSCTAGRFFTDWATREAYLICFSSDELRSYQLMFISNVTLQEKCEVNWTLTRVISKLRHFRWNLWCKQNYYTSDGWDVKSAPFLGPTDTWRVGKVRQRAPFPTASLSCWCWIEVEVLLPHWTSMI